MSALDELSKAYDTEKMARGRKAIKCVQRPWDKADQTVKLVRAIFSEQKCNAVKKVGYPRGGVYWRLTLLDFHAKYCGETNDDFN